VGLWRHLARGGRTLWRGRQADADLAAEVQHFLDEAAAEHEARGLSPEAARRAARLDVGTVAGVSEQVRASGWENVIVTAWRDLRYAGRRLSAEPAFTLVVALTLAIGIGATTAIFSAVNPILFEPLPYPSANRLAMIVEGRADGGRNGGTFAVYQEFLGRARTLDGIAVARAWQPTLVGQAEPYTAGKLFLGVDRPKTTMSWRQGATHIGELQAWDMKTGQRVWTHKFPYQNWGPILTTGGGLVFLGGTNDRNFRAFDAKTGKQLWEFRTNSGVTGVPSSFAVDGVQYVAVQSGWGVDAQRMQARLDTFLGTKTEVPQGGVVWVFALRD